MTDNDEFAPDYDAEASRYKWHGPEILFGLMHEFVEPAQTLLDIGIGTGLGSMPFQKAGLTIFGIDRSKEMLAVCRVKEFTHELIEHDFRKTPLPYPARSFDHIISCGVFQMLSQLDALVADISRLIKDLGTFGFTYQEHISGLADGFTSLRDGDMAEGIDPDSGTKIYRHSESYVMNRLFDNGFVVWKTQEFVGSVHPTTGTKNYFTAVVAQKRGDRVKRANMLDRLFGVK